MRRWGRSSSGRGGLPAGRCWPGWPPLSWPGRTSWWGWTGCAPTRPASRSRRGAGLATSTAAGIARRFTGKHWRGTEAGLAAATARMVDLLPAERGTELAKGPVTIDIDATDVNDGSKKRGVAYTYQGQRAGLLHAASWVEIRIWPAADLLAGVEDPRSSVVALLGRALAALPRAVRDGAAAAGRKIALRADAGYFAWDPLDRSTWPRRTWPSRWTSAPSGSPACGRRWPGSRTTPGGTR